MKLFCPKGVKEYLSPIGISRGDIWSRHEEAARLLSMRALSADKYLGTVLFGTFVFTKQIEIKSPLSAPLML
jgi:hypothetical protein